MNQRAARREAHRWVAAIIEGALGNGAADELAEDDAVKAAIKEIAERHARLGSS